MDNQRKEVNLDDEPLSLDMSFDEALEMLVNTPPPDETDDEELHQEVRNQDDYD